MLFLVVNALLFATLLALVVLPALYIYHPGRHPGESLGPPPAGEVILGDTISHSVKQKLYLLFMIPVCVTVNTLFLYFCYYQPIRFAQFRVEQNVLSLFQTRHVGVQQLRHSELAGFHRASSTITFSAMEHLSMHQEDGVEGSRGPERGGRDEKRSLYSSSAELRRHARPKSVLKDEYVMTCLFPEIRELYRQVESNFLIPGCIAEQNFMIAVQRLLEGYVVNSSGIPSKEQAAATGAVVSTTSGFYTSKRMRQPVAAIHGAGGGGRGSHLPLSGNDRDSRGGIVGESSVVMVLDDSFSDSTRWSVSAATPQPSSTRGQQRGRVRRDHSDEDEPFGPTWNKHAPDTYTFMGEEDPHDEPTKSRWSMLHRR